MQSKLLFFLLVSSNLFIKFIACIITEREMKLKLDGYELRSVVRVSQQLS
jgi:hypothetical protein